MDSLTNFLSSLLELLLQLGNILLQGLIILETWIRDQLATFGLPPAIQTAIMIGIAVILILTTLRFFGGLVRAVVVLVLLLIAIHILIPILPH